ncbi:MAG: Ldh family oxidoreductase [Rhodothermales bacterium]
MAVPYFTYPSTYLRQFTTQVFQHFGIPDEDASQAAEILALSDLRGIESHGVARLYAYHRKLKAGGINPTPNIRIVRETPSTATVDGDNGLGLVVGPWANRLAMEKAETVGSGWVSVCHSNHFGIAGYYPMQALERDLIGWAMTNATGLVAPLWSRERMLGTNPIAIAFPGAEEPPIVIDMATSVVPYGKIEIARRLEQPVPEGWIIDADGHATTDPNAMPAGGALLPLGAERAHGGHKGYALSSMVDILTSVLSGASWGPFAPSFALQHGGQRASRGQGLGQFFGAMQIAGFRDPDEFKQEIDVWIRTFRAAEPAAGTDGPLIPGDPERLAHAQRSMDGIPLAEPVVQDLRRIGQDIGVTFDP